MDMYIVDKILFDMLRMYELKIYWVFVPMRIQEESKNAEQKSYFQRILNKHLKKQMFSLLRSNLELKVFIRCFWLSAYKTKKIGIWE